MSEEGPVWQRDDEVDSCFVCESKYNLFNRRHHCRKCGRVVCGGCSSQQVRYFPNTLIVAVDDRRSVSRPNGSYRTCDVCVEEIKMVRRALFAQSQANSIASGSTTSLESGVLRSHVQVDNDSLTKYAVNVRAVPMSSTSSSMVIPRYDLTNDNDLDSNLCPICATNLINVYISSHKKNIDEITKEKFEKFKEQHIDNCLVDFDFNQTNQRLSPGDRSAPRNKMLVYNIPPIPGPTYESIPIGDVGSINEGNSQVNEIIGSVNSNSTIHQNEKVEGEYDNECLICLEDLQPGDKVGRLECLCVFHYKCIKDWFNKKGYGECPVHFLHK